MIWEPIAAAGLVSGLIGIAMAAALYMARPDRTQNRLLAAFLLLAGSAWLVSRGIMPMLEAPGAVFAAACVYYALYLGTHLFHLLFLATLDTPWVRLLRRPGVRRGLIVAFTGLAGAVVLFPASIWHGVTSVPVHGRWYPVPVAWHNAYNLAFAALWAYGLLAVLSTRKATGYGATATPLGAYRLGFLVHHSGLVLYLLWDIFGNAGLAGQALLLKATLPPALLNIWLAGWVGYGTLRAQVFDVELRVKRGVAAAVTATVLTAGVVLTGAALALALAVDAVPAILFGLAMVALLTPRLVDVGTRAAQRLMPHVQDTADYRLNRKKEVYIAELQSALAKGEIGAGDRSRLTRLQARLCLPKAEAHRLEKVARDGVAVRGA